MRSAYTLHRQSPAHRSDVPSGAEALAGAALNSSLLNKAAGAGGGEAARKRGHAVYSAIDKAIQRLEDLIDEETAALRAHKAMDLKDFNNRKSQALYELTRVSRQVEDVAGNPEILDRLKTLRSKLETNRNLIKIHMEAVGEVLTIMTEAIHEAESDGTYSVGIRNAGKKP
jgi:DNA repair ATPase RecN